MDSCPLPEEAIIEILGRLPVKSLIRFKCINKTWRDLICSSYFATRQLDLNKDKTCLSSYIRMSHFQMQQLFTDGKHASYFHLSFIGSTKYGDMSNGRMVWSSNGLVCFCEGYNHLCLTVWNPATGDFRRIPASIDARRALRKKTPLLGFDVRPCGDYRVVVIAPARRPDVVAAIHGKNSNCWKIISNVLLAEAAHRVGIHDATTLNGCMYYAIIETRDVNPRYLNVACFDMWEEKYKRISGPHCSGHSGRLGLVNGSSLGFFFAGKVVGTLDGWVMNSQEGSWTKKYSVVLFTPVQFKSVEEVDMIMLDKDLHFYDHATNQLNSFSKLPNHVGSGPFPKSPGHLGVCPYKESLFSVQNTTK